MRLQNFRGGMMALAAVLASGAVLLAHMKLDKSEPAADATLAAPPAHVRLSFSEAPDIKVSKLEIKGPSVATKLDEAHVNGKVLEADVKGDVPDGAYSVQWQAAGDDGHVQKGELKFTVKRK